MLLHGSLWLYMLGHNVQDEKYENIKSCISNSVFFLGMPSTTDKAPHNELSYTGATIPGLNFKEIKEEKAAKKRLLIFYILQNKSKTFLTTSRTVKRLPHSETFNWKCAEPESTSKFSRSPRHSRSKGRSLKQESLCQNYNSSWLQKFLNRSGKRLTKGFARKFRSDSKSTGVAPQVNLREIIGLRKSLRKVGFDFVYSSILDKLY